MIAVRNNFWRWNVCKKVWCTSSRRKLNRLTKMVFRLRVTFAKVGRTRCSVSCPSCNSMVAIPFCSTKSKVTGSPKPLTNSTRYTNCVMDENANAQLNKKNQSKVKFQFQIMVLTLRVLQEELCYKFLEYFL